MLQRLPKIPTNAKFDIKNGWLPSSFAEQCREIVNKYVSEAVQEELRREQPQQEPDENSGEQDESIESKETISYCSKMLSNIKKGIYKSVNIMPWAEETLKREGNSKIVDTVDLVEGKKEFL